MKRFVVLPMFAAVLLSGCSRTLHPTITVTPQNGGSSFVISGSGFSSGSPCATLSYVPPPGVTSIKKDVPCKGGQFNPPVPWTPHQIPGCTANTPVAVIAVDHKTATLTWASVTILCEAALCPSSFTESTFPKSMANYFTSGSSVSWGAYPSGSMGMTDVWNTDTCVNRYIFKLESSGQVGGSEVCTYKAVGLTSTSSICTTSEVTGQDMTLVFTCPDSGDCVK